MKKAVEVQYVIPDGPEVLINEMGLTMWRDGQSVYIDWDQWLLINNDAVTYRWVVKEINGEK